MKLLKNKKFWAMTLGVTLVGAGIVAIAASCSNSTVKSKLSSQFVKSTDDKSFYAVYEIENFKDLSDNDKKSLNDIEFNAALTSVENKTENLVTKGHLVGEKIYVKLPREPKPNEQLTIINKSGLIKTSGLLIPNNLNYQTEKVNFETAAAPSQQPSPAPTPKTEEPKENGGGKQQTDQPENSKKDDVVASGVKISEVKNNTATIEVTFSKFELADANKKEFVLEVNKKQNALATPIVATELNYNEQTKTLSAKLSGLDQNVDYEISKLTLNGKEVKFNEEELLKSYVKNAKLLIKDKGSKDVNNNLTNKTLNIMLNNFSILNYFEDSQPILTFDIQGKKMKEGKTLDDDQQIIHKSFIKKQLLNKDGIDFNVNLKNGYQWTITNVKLVNISLEDQQYEKLNISLLNKDSIDVNKLQNFINELLNSKQKNS
ncbi:multiple banded antigen [Ureaplasma parvum]|uniref:multiple banded antigen n=1 Tax=Ureaplasma parvum TaxID=134821 RepID=UPI001163F0A4|nr:DUF1410 domain-containing protein [Ureaplasma parvum]QDI64587.2 multiple banded antigen [Ureaplasma parvum]